MTLTGKGKWNLTCFRLCINYVKSKVQYLFICRHLLGGLSCTQINTFSFGRCVSLEGSSCIQVNIMYFTADAGYFNKTFSDISCWSTLNKSSINECSLQLHTFHNHVDTILSPWWWWWWWWWRWWWCLTRMCTFKLFQQELWSPHTPCTYFPAHGDTIWIPIVITWHSSILTPCILLQHFG